MLWPLIVVLVLLAVGFYALSIGVTGRVSVGEGPELTAPARLLTVVIALIAFVAAYLVYQRPRDELSDADQVAAMPSIPPATRGSEPVPPPAEPVAAQEPDEEAEPAAEVPAEREMAAEDEAEEQPEPATKVSAAAADPSLSTAAAALEERARQRRSRRAAAPVAMPVAEPMDEVQEEEVAAVAEPRAASAKPRQTAAASTREPAAPRRKAAVAPRRVVRGGPLLLHVSNALGRDQQREQLTLLIEGKVVAEIEVDDYRPDAAVAIELPRPGLLHYRLEGVSENQRSTRLVGEGCIRVNDGSRYVVRRKDGSRRVFLEAATG